MNTSEQIQEVEITLAEATKLSDKADALERMIHTKDFQLVVDTGYFHDEAVRLVHLKADENMQSAENQAYIDNCMLAIGTLKEHFNKVRLIGNTAKKSIRDNNETLDELREEVLLGDGA